MSGLFGDGAICQVAVVVHDIEASAARYAAVFGMEVPEPIITGTSDETNIRFEGQPTEARAKLAFFQMGPLSLELIEPIGGPSTWRKQLEEHGQSIHHIAFHVPDADATVAHLADHGIEVQQTGDYKGGRYVYADATRQLGLTLELLQNV